jgi:hypothetical protein
LNTRSIPAVLAFALASALWPAAAGAGNHLPAPTAGLPARALAIGPTAPASEQTHPKVRPARGHPATRFVLELTARQRLGATTGSSADYRVTVSRAGGGCGDALEISSAAAGAHLRRTLRPPSSAGWCRGRYAGSVILDRAPSCAPQANGRPVACPDFMLAPVVVGRFGFTVT